MLLPRTLSVSNEMVGLSLMVILTDLRCVFILMSTPAVVEREREREENGCASNESERGRWCIKWNVFTPFNT